jgi:hypothetical protein
MRNQRKIKINELINKMSCEKEHFAGNHIIFRLIPSHFEIGKIIYEHPVNSCSSRFCLYVTEGLGVK